MDRDRRPDVTGMLVHPDYRDELFRKAREARALHFGDDVFAYGFDYFSTHCENLCTFCQYRAGNPGALRYRHDLDSVVRCAGELARSGVHLIDLTMGEDPFFMEDPDRLVEVVGCVAEETGLPVMVSPGVVEAGLLPRLRDAGASWLALYQETFDRAAFAGLRVGQGFGRRLGLKRAALDAGLLVEEGILTGWGDTAGQFIDSLLELGNAGASQVRVMTLVPQAGTPLAALAPPGSDRELVGIALMRLLYPDKLIPASLDVEGAAGLRARLDAGANVVTSVIPPGLGFAGVARSGDVDASGRALAAVEATVREAGLRLAPQRSYEAFLERERARVGAGARAGARR